MPANAFTMAEMLVVLLLVFLLSQIALERNVRTDLLYTETLKEACVSAQMEAFAEKRSIDVRFGTKEALIGEKAYPYPRSMACTPLSFSYTPSGTITKGGSVTCTNEEGARRLVFQIGMGRVRVE